MAFVRHITFISLLILVFYGMVQLALWQTAPVSIPVQRRAIAFYLTLASVIPDTTGQRDT